MYVLNEKCRNLLGNLCNNITIFLYAPYITVKLSKLLATSRHGRTQHFEAGPPSINIFKE